MPPTSFKSDESFLQKVAVGAAGTNATIEKLKAQGFEPIELERGSTGYKIWKRIKIKRVRVPDILCLRTGQRFESRGKTKLEISMSHSLKDPYRAWDYGMRPDDQVAVLLCDQASDSPIDWKPAPIHFVKVSDMRKAVANKLIKITKPKGVEEGSEIRMIWPTVAANEMSVVTEINERSMKLQPQGGGKRQLCILSRAAGTLIPQCKVGDIVQAKQIVASIVSVQLAPRPIQQVDEEYSLLS